VLVRNDRANVMRPLRFPAPPSSLPGLDRAPAALAGLSGGMGEVIFPWLLIAFGEVGIGKPSAFGRDIALRWCVSGGHLQSFPGPVAKTSRCIWMRTVTTLLCEKSGYKRRSRSVFRGQRRAWDSNPR
jgi:hypothetical protein